MNLLLDTHAYLWQASNPEKLPKAAIRAMESRNASLFVSVASLWEIAILISLKRIEISGSIQRLVDRSLRYAGIQVVPIEPDHVDSVADLPFFHRDPFDRLIVAQAKSLEATVIGKDEAFDRYGIERLWR